MILAGDIGGTKTLLGSFARLDDGSLSSQVEKIYDSASHASLEEIVNDFRREHPELRFEVGSFGVAGVIVDGEVHTTNLPWRFSADSLRQATGLREVRLLNDLEATAIAMPYLDRKDLAVLNAGRSRGPGNTAVIAAGTGLGEAILFWDGMRYKPIATEGGHADFAPRTEAQIELLRYLNKKYREHVSYERVLSGHGIFNIYCYLRDTDFAPESAWLRDELARAHDPTVVVSQLGLSGQDRLCTEALAMFAEIYGAEAGNLALKCLARGGVYLAGGIAPKLLSALKNDRFMQAFCGKGRMSVLLESYPVYVSLNMRAALLGAARAGLQAITG